MLNTLCDLCHNPYPYMCNECQQTLVDEQDIFQDEVDFLTSQGSIKPAEKIYIGSGEDVMMDML